jgi:CheY-like chemotaxis protein
LVSIRKGKETKNVPVVMTSGEDVKDECIQRGANAFLLKPYMPDDLIGILRSNIEK